MVNKDVLLLTALFVLTCHRSAESSTLIQSLKSVAVAVSPQNVPEVSSATIVTDPIPGKMKVCENLCPKWCQPLEGSDRNFTNCHYHCGNICDEKTRLANPFIGDAQFEVVPSVYDFGKYDVDGDKQISIQEFSLTENIPVDEAMELFAFADFNNDGYIDTDEFQGGPMIFTVQMAAELSNIARTGGHSTTVGTTL